MVKTIVEEASLTWRGTYIGYSLEDMTKWWVAARWYDERLILTEEELNSTDMDTTRPWWQPCALGIDNYLYEILGERGWCWDNYQECKTFCEVTNADILVKYPRTVYFALLHPLNIGDYIRWEDRVIDNHKLRKLSDPIYKASQRFFALRPEGWASADLEVLNNG